jgi:23S rRNA pseudouridine1911/1915/1917 synthase
LNQRNLVVDGESDGQRLDRFLALSLPHLSRSYLKKLIDDKLVLIDNRSVRASRRIRAGERIEVIEPPPRPAEPQAEFMPLSILFEDKHLLVLDKQAGLVVHPAPGCPDGTLVNALLHHCHDLSGIGGVERPGIVHRLDRNTSGLLIVSKSDQAHRALAEQFQTHQVEKTYLAYVVQRKDAQSLPKKGTFDTLFGRHPVHRKRFSSKVDRGKRAITHFEVLKRFLAEKWTAVKVQIKLQTGRTHQIRVHLTDNGHPLLGDKLYGGRSLRDFPHDAQPERQALHAYRLSFFHPISKKRMGFEAPLPNDLVDLERALTNLSNRFP